VPEHRPPEFNVNINIRSAIGIALALLIVFVVAVLALTSYYTVAADSQGVVLRFGKYLKTVEFLAHGRHQLDVRHQRPHPLR
jgi:regulator of protease activity HflC (stomatin/prohibitin superfamily)